MANNDGFLDVLSESTLKELREANTLVLEISKNIDKANAKIGGAKTPGASDSAIKALNDQIVAQEKAIGKLQSAYAKLSEEQKKKNVASVQERVDNSILLQQQKQNATIISEVAGAYRRLSAEEARSARAVQDLISRGRLATQTQKQFNTEVRKAQTEFDGYRKRVLAADAAVGRWQRTGTRTIQGANELAGALGFTLGITGVVMLGKAIFDTTRELQGLDLALNQVIGSQEEAAKTQEFLSRIAEAYGVNIQTLTRSYIGFFASAKNAIDEGKITGEQINQIFESVAKAAGALGLSVDQQQGAFLAIQQMISKGNIQAEELRGQLSERLPGAFGILAKSMGVTEVQLNKMLKDGKVLAAEVLPAFARELEKAYGVENLNRVETLNASVTRLGNSWTDFVASLNDGGGAFSSGLAAIVDKLAEAVKGASIILQSEESRRNDVLSSIRQKAYDNTLAYYNSLEKIDEAYIARKKIQHLETIKDLQDQVRINKEANDEIRRLANSGNYVEDAPNSLKTNQLAIRSLNGQIKAYYGMIAAGDAVLQKNNKTLNKNTELTKEQLKAIEDAARERYQTALATLELELQVIDTTLENDEVYYTTRLRALELHRVKRQEILLLQFNEEFRQAKGNYDKQQQALIKFHSASLKEIESFNKKEEELQSLRLKEGGLATSKLAKNAQDELNESALKNIEILEKQVEAEKKHKEGLELLKKAMDDYKETFLSDVFDNAGLSTFFDILNGDILGFGENAITTALAVSEAFQEMFNFIRQASQQNFDAEYEQNTRQTELAKKFAGDNDVAVAEIERQSEERRKEIRKRELKANKDLAKFNILIDSAQGIVAAFKDGNIVKGAIFAAVIAGIAAVQLSALNNVPEYWKGTDNAPGGYAWVDERGPEIHTDKHGKIKSTGESKANLRKLEKGDKIIPHLQSKALMFDNGLNNILSNNGISATQNINVSSQFPTQEFNAGVSRIESAVSNIPGMQWTDKGVKRFYNKQNQRVANMNNRASGRGKTNP